MYFCHNLFVIKKGNLKYKKSKTQQLLYARWKFCFPMTVPRLKEALSLSKIMLAGVRKMLNHAHTKSRLSPSHNLRDWKRSEREWSLVRSVIFKARSVYCPTSFRELLVLKSWSRMQTLIQNDKDYSWLSFHLASAKSLGSMRQTSI